LRKQKSCTPFEIRQILSASAHTYALHRHADMDCIACAYALQKEFGGTVWGPGGLDRGAKLLQQLFSIDMSDAPGPPRLVVLDTPEITQFDGMWEEIVLIDHHPSATPEADFFYVDESAHSCSEMVYGIISEHIDRNTAIALLAGILYDTGRLKRGSATTLSICASLLSASGMELDQLIQLTSEEREISETVAVLKGLERMKHEIYADTVIGITAVSAFESSVASAMLHAGVNVAFVISQKEEKVRVTGRADRHALDVGIDLNEIMRVAASEFGGEGGGHPGAAVLEFNGDGEAVALALAALCRERLRAS
jgi:nanoRNase/pAp phosphatase (c-di-AMP/oligoRNAs hydrolase)